MRICIIDYDMSVYGGIETVSAYMANELSKNNEVYVVSICGEGNPQCFNNNVHYENLMVEPRRLTKMRSESIKKVSRFIKDNRIDVAVAMGSYAGALSVPVVRKGGCKYIFSDHGALINQLNDKKVTMIRRIMSKISNHIVVLTERSKADYIRLFKTSKKKLTVIYNAICRDVYEKTGSYDTGSKLIVSSGRFGTEKGYDMLVKVAEKVLKDNADWKWHIYGDGDTFDEIKKEISERGIENQLILMGKTGDMYDLYKKYALLVLPSYREGLPMVLLEARANHLPIVSFDIATGPAEIVKDGLNGYLVEPYNIDKMAEAINKLIKNNELRNEFSKHAYDEIEKFSMDSIIEQWEELFEHMCGRR